MPPLFLNLPCPFMPPNLCASHYHCPEFPCFPSHIANVLILKDLTQYISHQDKELRISHSFQASLLPMTFLYVLLYSVIITKPMSLYLYILGSTTVRETKGAWVSIKQIQCMQSVLSLWLSSWWPKESKYRKSPFLSCSVLLLSCKSPQKFNFSNNVKVIRVLNFQATEIC